MKNVIAVIGIFLGGYVLGSCSSSPEQTSSNKSGQMSQIEKASKANESAGIWAAPSQSERPGGAVGLCYLSFSEVGEHVGVIVDRGTTTATFYRVNVDQISKADRALFTENADKNLTIMWDAHGRIQTIRLH